MPVAETMTGMYIVSGLASLASSCINAWQAGKNRQSSERISALSRDSSEEVARLSRKHSAELQYNQLKFLVLQQRENQDFQKELAELSHERLKEIEVFRAEVNFAINQKNLDFQKWRFEQEKKIQFEMLQLQQDFQRDLSQIQHQNALIQMRERMRADQSPINNLACDLLENSFSHDIMPLKVFFAPPILDYDPSTAKPYIDGYEGFLAKEIEQFLHQGYLNSKQYPVQLLDGSWVSKKQGGGSALQSIHAQLKSIPVLILESKIPAGELNLGLGYWNSGDTSYTQSSILSGIVFSDLLCSSAKHRALEWEVTRKKLEALGKDETYIQNLGGVNEENLKTYHKEKAEKTELEQHGIDTSNLPVSKQYKITDADYKSFYQYLAVYHCLVIGLYADTLFLGNSWENTPLLPSLIPYLMEKYKNHFLLTSQFWQEAISKFVTAYGQFYDGLKSDASSCLPEVRMKLALSLANLPNEYKYLALKQCDQAVADWLAANNVPSDKVFDMDNDDDCQTLKGIFYQEDKPFLDSIKQLLAIVNEAENIDLSKVKRINSLLEPWRFLSRFGNISALPQVEVQHTDFYDLPINQEDFSTDESLNYPLFIQENNTQEVEFPPFLNEESSSSETSSTSQDYLDSSAEDTPFLPLDDDLPIDQEDFSTDELPDYPLFIQENTQEVEFPPFLDKESSSSETSSTSQDYLDSSAEDTPFLPLDADTYNELGNENYNLNEYEEAIDYYNQAIHVDPKYVYAYYNRGLAYKRLGNTQKALSNFRQAATLYQEQGKTDDYDNTNNRIKELGGYSFETEKY